MWGAAAIAIAFSLVAHWSVMKDLGVVISPGIVGGALFLFIQVLYLPNAAFAGLAYLTNIGFSLGSATQISATHFTLHGIPAIPLLASLPTGKHPLLKYGPVLIIIFILLALLPTLRENSLFKSRQFFALRTSFALLVIITVIAYTSSGELLTTEMRPVGVIWWKVTAFFASSMLVVALFSVYIPALVKRVSKRV